MPELDLTAYRATYDPEAWARVIEQYPTTDARTQLLVPACLAIRALCDEMERLRGHVDDPPPADAALLASANRDLVERLEKAQQLIKNQEEYLAILRRDLDWEQQVVVPDMHGNMAHAVTRAEKAERALDEAQAMLDAVRGRAEQDGLQAILDVLDRKPVPGPVPGYIAGEVRDA